MKLYRYFPGGTVIKMMNNRVVSPTVWFVQNKQGMSKLYGTNTLDMADEPSIDNLRVVSPLG